MCFICEHDRRPAIDVALQAGVKLVEVKRIFALHTQLSAIGYHRDVCLLGKTRPEALRWARRKAEQAEFAAMRRPETLRALGQPVGDHYIDDIGAHRLGCAAVLQAIKDAQRGNPEAIGWINGDDSRRFVAWLNLNLEDYWPPTPDQIASACVDKRAGGLSTPRAMPIRT